MTDDDDLDALRAALKASPAPDPARKQADLSAAMVAFEKIHTPAQESEDAPRPSIDRPIWGRLTQGAKRMFNTLTTKAGLTVTTGIVTAGLAVAVFLPMQQVGVPADMTLRDPARTTAAPTSGVQTTTERRELRLEKFADEGARPAAEALQSQPQPRTTATEDAAPAPAPQVFQEPFTTDREALAEPAPHLDRLMIAPENDTEAFANAAENPLKVVAEDPVSTFSVDVDTASYAVVRQSLMAGQLPPRDAVRVEEMVNYFPYDYPAPEAGGAPFQPTVTVTETPWRDGTQLVHVVLQGEMPVIDERPPLNLVFLIDTSGSMAEANKLPLLQQSFRLMLSELRPEDQVAIVTYAGSAGQVLEPTPASDRTKILTALDNLQSGGGTAGQAGLQQAYSVAEGMAEDGEVTRILLATDGDFNVGLSDVDQLKDFIADKRDGGTYLSVLGFGRGNLDDATMQALAQNGNGQAAYIDTLNEARKVLVDQLTGALFPIAGDVKVQVEFNPAQIAEYRLIGYETRALRREDFDNDKVDAGDIGAGHRVTAIYEVTPVGSPARATQPLRYGAAETVANPLEELGFLRLRYKEPGATESQLIETPITADLGTATTETRFATAIAGFGQLLRGSDQLGDWSYADAIALATEGRGTDRFGYRAEAINLMRLAESLSR
ncbi:VWA domain-containing protein [Actibacterium sp. 188UL27-1]|uniref:vWA domain-containing protein n=1 Tax=Actibacterium sp. 188UL27-1 TaxID=2786961 RepID=UPI00195B2BC2|nr:VWA domain-containing protein [Actibacterium sp. 188UL27-1]MBM7066280.1 VWA domain-containing protein [Actibacterium sp. 188UL27-1]